LRRNSIAVAEPPEHALSRVAGHREVGGADVAEVLVEHRLVRIQQPPVGDRIAVQEQIDVALPGRRDEPFVPRSHALVGLRERRRHVQSRRLQQHQRLEFLQQRLHGRSVAGDEARQRRVHLLQFGRRRARNRHFRRHRRRWSNHHRGESAAAEAWHRSAWGGGSWRLPRRGGHAGAGREEKHEDDRSLGHLGILPSRRHVLAHVGQDAGNRWMVSTGRHSIYHPAAPPCGAEASRCAHW
jgi:hypothetical protein